LRATNFDAIRLFAAGSVGGREGNSMQKGRRVDGKVKSIAIGWWHVIDLPAIPQMNSGSELQSSDLGRVWQSEGR